MTIEIDMSDSEVAPVVEEVPVATPFEIKLGSQPHVTRTQYLGIHDQGQGMVAAATIPAGELIMIDKPVYWLERDIVDEGPPCAEEENEITKIFVTRLSPYVKKRLMNMSNQIPHVREGNNWISTPVSGRIRTNVIPFALGHGQDRYPELGFFLTAAKLNHSCHPNAAQTWNKDTREETFYATRTIKAGEQITISYVPEARIDPYWLRDKLHIYCTCKWCLTPNSPARKASDTNHRDLHRLGQDFSAIEDPKLALSNCWQRVCLNHQEEINDWRKGLAFEDGFDALAKIVKDTARGKLLLMLAYLGYWRCEGWNTSKGPELGVKWASLFEDMSAERGKELLFKMVEKYVDDQDRGLIEDKHRPAGSPAVTVDTDDEPRFVGNGESPSGSKPALKLRSYRTPKKTGTPRITRHRIKLEEESDQKIIMKVKFDAEKVWQQLKAPFEKPEVVEDTLMEDVDDGGVEGQDVQLEGEMHAEGSIQVEGEIRVEEAAQVEAVLEKAEALQVEEELQVEGEVGRETQVGQMQAKEQVHIEGKTHAEQVHAEIQIGREVQVQEEIQIEGEMQVGQVQTGDEMQLGGEMQEVQFDGAEQVEHVQIEEENQVAEEMQVERQSQVVRDTMHDYESILYWLFMVTS